MERRPTDWVIATPARRATRVAKDDPWERTILEDPEADFIPGRIIGMVTEELTARKFAGVTRLQVSADMPKKLQHWICKQLKADPSELEPIKGLMSLADLRRDSQRRHFIAPSLPQL